MREREKKLKSYNRLALPLVNQYGAETFEAASLQVLGYPGTWIHTYSEVQKLENHFNQGESLPCK